MYKLMQGDCLELMDEIEDKSIDMILADLPYGKTANRWDTVIDLDRLWEQYNRIIKDNGAILLFAQPPFNVTLGLSNIKNYRYDWVYRKSKPSGFLNANRMPLKNHEYILVFYKKLPTYNPQMRKGKPYFRKCGTTSSNYLTAPTPKGNYGPERYPISVLDFKVELGLHPTQKPVPLLEHLIKTYTNKGEVVLDNAMGSGSTGVACINTGRQFVGIEIEKEYFDIAKDRIDKEYELKKKVKQKELTGEQND